MKQNEIDNVAALVKEWAVLREYEGKRAKLIGRHGNELEAIDTLITISRSRVANLILRLSEVGIEAGASKALKL
jgi:predicted RNA-binding protein YlqC (UPF0109 family)